MIVIQDSHGKWFSQFSQPHLSGASFPVFSKPSESYPVQIAVYASSEETEPVLKLIRNQIEDRSMLQHRHGQVEIVNLGEQIEILKRQVQMYEDTRPHWAQGYTSDGVAAQTATAALSQIWRALGVDNQTGAMARLKGLSDPVEILAKAIYEGWPGADKNPWVPGGNSDQQYVARKQARGALESVKS